MSKMVQKSSKMYQNRPQIFRSRIVKIFHCARKSLYIEMEKWYLFLGSLSSWENQEVALEIVCQNYNRISITSCVRPQDDDTFD